MFDRLGNYVDAPARVFLAAIFILSGIGKVGAFEGTQAVNSKKATSSLRR